jgi:hypothetical protein
MVSSRMVHAKLPAAVTFTIQEVLAVTFTIQEVLGRRVEVLGRRGIMSPPFAVALLDFATPCLVRRGHFQRIPRKAVPRFASFCGRFMWNSPARWSNWIRTCIFADFAADQEWLPDSNRILSSTGRMQNLSPCLSFCTYRPFHLRNQTIAHMFHVHAGVSDVEACARQLATLERTLDATIFALEDRDCVEQFAPTPNEIVLHYDSEGVVDAGLMKRLQRLISQAVNASSEARKQALRNEDQNVTTTNEKEERSDAMKENVDGRSGQISGNETGAETEAVAKKGNNSALAEPRSDGQTEAEAKVSKEAAGKPGDSALGRRLQKEGEGGGSPSLETGLVGEELGKGEDGEDRDAEVWRGARPISVEAGRMAAKLLARVKHTWEELGQFCAFKVGPVSAVFFE